MTGKKLKLIACVLGIIAALSLAAATPPLSHNSIAASGQKNTPAAKINHGANPQPRQSTATAVAAAPTRGYVPPASTNDNGKSCPETSGAMPEDSSCGTCNFRQAACNCLDRKVLVACPLPE